MTNIPTSGKTKKISQAKRTMILAALILLPFGLYLALQTQNLLFAGVLFAMILLLTLVLVWSD